MGGVWSRRAAEHEAALNMLAQFLDGLGPPRIGILDEEALVDDKECRAATGKQQFPQARLQRDNRLVVGNVDISPAVQDRPLLLLATDDSLRCVAVTEEKCGF